MAKNTVGEEWGQPLPKESAQVGIEEPQLTGEEVMAQALVKIAEILQEIRDEMRKK